MAAVATVSTTINDPSENGGRGSRSASKLVNVSWPKHHQVFVDGLWNSFLKNFKVDVEVTSHGHRIQAHQLVLAIFCPNLRKCMQEEGRLNWDDDALQPEELDLLVEFVYRGKVALPEDRLEKLQKAAEIVGILGLNEAIERTKNGEYGVIVQGEGDDVNEVESSRNPREEIQNNQGGANRRKRKSTPVKIPKVLHANHDSDADEDTVSSAAKHQTLNHHSQRESRTVTHKLKMFRGNAPSGGGDGDGTRNLRRSTSRMRNNAGSPHERSDGDDYVWGDCPALDQDDEGEDDDDCEGDSGGSDYEPKKSKTSLRTKKVLAPKREKEEPGDCTADAESEFATSPLPTTKTKTTRTEYKKMWRQNQPLQKCSYCPYETRDKDSFKSHIAKHDPNAERHVCAFCSKTFRSKRGFVRHQSTHIDPNCLLKCPSCDFHSPQKSSLVQHLAAVHKVDPQGNPITGKYKCSECDYFCLFECQLKLHVLRKHEKERPFKCSECDYGAVLKTDLDKHISIRHRNERPYMCEICGFRSQSQGGHNRHRRSHTGEKPFTCDICGKMYADSRKFKIHLRRHEHDEKPFVCHVCGHACRRKDNLKMHLKRIHKSVLEGDGESTASVVHCGMVIRQKTEGECQTLSFGDDDDMMRVNSSAGSGSIVQCGMGMRQKTEGDCQTLSFAEDEDDDMMRGNSNEGTGSLVQCGMGMRQKMEGECQTRTFGEGDDLLRRNSNDSSSSVVQCGMVIRQKMEGECQTRISGDGDEMLRGHSNRQVTVVETDSGMAGATVDEEGAETIMAIIQPTPGALQCTVPNANAISTDAIPESVAYYLYTAAAHVLEKNNCSS